MEGPNSGQYPTPTPTPLAPTSTASIPPGTTSIVTSPPTCPSHSPPGRRPVPTPERSPPAGQFLQTGQTSDSVRGGELSG